MTEESLPELRIPIADQRLGEVASEVPGNRILCASIGRGQVAYQLARSRPAAQVVCWFLDEVRRRLAVEYGQPRPENVQLICEPDFPPDSIDLAVLSCQKNGEAELTRELLQTAVQRLQIGGTLIASVDFSRDGWLGGQMDALFSKVSVRRFDDATVYLAKKTHELKKIRDFQAEFAYRDHGRLIKVTTRPGVFAHRRLDVGARRLLDAVSNCDGLRVLDIGCGCGSVGLGIAARSPTASVHAIDSNARAVACAIANVELNSIDNMAVELDCDGFSVASSGFDLVLANPPYYANHSIAEKFVETARRGLRSGGRLVVVTKHPAWYQENIGDSWVNVHFAEQKQYHVMTADRL